MADNKSKVDRLHGLLPKHLNTRSNVNWNGLLEAIGGADQVTSDLVSEVRKQFFVKTSSRPYIDRLAANNKISRPRLVGMSDTSFRDYIPVLSYQPKQVKLIIDALLDIFFFKESTTAFVMSQSFQPFTLSDGWELLYTVDGIYDEKIVFNAADFTNIAAANASEIVAAFNRQAKYSYATDFYDSITKKNFIRIFTKTVGSKGSIELVGGRANIALQLNGFISTAGNGSNTQWTISKIGDLTTYQHTGGASPGLDKLQEGDVIISNLSGNVGSFKILEVDISNNKIKFINLFSTPGVITQTSSNQTKFIRPEKYVAYKTSRRAMTWETSTGEIVVEMPTTPPVVQRSLKGSTHINGQFSLMTNRDSDTSLTVVDATGFPKSGSFIIEPVNAITSRILTPDIDEVVTKNSNGRLIYNVQKYEFASRIILSTLGNLVAGSNQITVSSVAGLSNGMTIFAEGLRQDAIITNISGLTVTSSVAATNTINGATVEFGNNTLTGVTPNLPAIGSLNQFTLSSLSRTSNVVTGTTATPHGYLPGETVIISGSTPIAVTESLNGSFIIDSVTSTTFTYKLIGTNGVAATPGSSRVERLSAANEGSKIIITDSQSSDDTRIKGSYVWDTSAPYVLSSATAEIQAQIQAGTIARLVDISSNEIPNESGFLIFDYGRNNQEGPVRYLYKPADNTIAIDPSYIFLKTHAVGSPIVALRQKGPHVMDTRAGEYAPYITDPSEAREILKELIRSVKSAGIFVNFLIRFPEQLYATLDVYQSGVDPG